MIETKESTADVCWPLLQKLWPDKAVILPIDNTLGKIRWTGRQYSNIKVRYWLATYNDCPIACTTAYQTWNDELRIRGTYCDPEFRRTGAAASCVTAALTAFDNIRLAYTFPRMGVEGFYQSLGFTIGPERWPNIYKGVAFAWKSL